MHLIFKEQFLFRVYLVHRFYLLYSMSPQFRYQPNIEFAQRRQTSACKVYEPVIKMRTLFPVNHPAYSAQTYRQNTTAMISTNIIILKKASVLHKEITSIT